MKKALILDIVDAPAELEDKLHEWAVQNEMGQNTYRELDFRFFDEGELSLTEKYIKENNPDNLPVYLCVCGGNMQVFDVTSNADYYNLLSFRRSCKLNGERGMVTEGNTVFIVTEYGNYEGDVYPQIEHNIWNMTAKLAKGE